MSASRKILLLCCGLAILPISDRLVVAQKTKIEKPRNAVKPQSKKKSKEFTDEQILPQRQIKKRTKTEKKRLEALSFYMTGRMKRSRSKNRRDLQAAYADFIKAVELDPDAVEIYKALAPLAFRLNKMEDGVKYAEKAIKLDPHDFILLGRLGELMVGRRQLNKAVEYFENAVKSERIDKTSAIYVSLNRNLVILYKALGKKIKLANAFEIIFDSRVNSHNYKLDFRARRRLENDSNITFEKMGTAFLDVKRYKKAKKAFQEAAGLGKSKPGVLDYYQARISFEMGNSDKSLEELQKYFDAKQRFLKQVPYELLSQILNESKKSETLIPRVEKLLKSDFGNPHLQLFLADRYLVAKRLDDAKKLYLEAQKSNKNSAVHLGLAAIYRMQKNPSKWLSTLTNVMSGTQNLRTIQTNLAKMEEEVKKFGEDKMQVDDLIAIARKKLAAENQKPSFAESLIVAKTAVIAKRTPAVIEFYRDSLKRRRRAASVIYNELGTYLLMNQNYEEAAKVFQEAIDEPGLADGKPNNLFRLSQAFAFHGATKKALEAVSDARKILPNVALLHFQEGWIYYHSRQWDRAATIFEKVMEDFPTDKATINRCKFSLSNIYVQQGHLKKGEVILEKIYVEDPDDASVNNDLGYLYVDHDKNLEKAEKMIEKALKAEPENGAYLDSMGWAQFKLGKYKEARKNLKKAIEKSDGNDSTLWDHLGDCLLKLNETEKAVEAWKKSLKGAKKEIFPDTKFIEKVEGKLKLHNKPAIAPRPVGK